ncbi:hypothetical protein EIZ47_06835 [Chryseobacterium lacus]|uniref:Lipoprotein n=1 Tax=Chryseobacterium lacus TaxID=2058346 RepID=A0A368N0R8_9FLAO|nr:hypothetical protein [Chryseobacterium lacus]RCU43155.1 hypothetical protein DQ356_06920 [Chryseobacterium lacus]RST28003.1 hypothetical protein EIZ47_06835 [Chryseobacterium lacus]
MKNIIILVFLFVFFQSCIDCKRDTDTAYNEECNLVVEISPTEYPYLFKAKGYDPITKEVKICHNDSRWWSLYKKEIEEGDTIVKKKGDLVFYIHKKDTVIAHEWVCYDGKGKHTYTNK